jgi:hypothetical protein
MPSILPTIRNRKCDTRISQFWSTSGLPSECMEALGTFLRTRAPEDFGLFTDDLYNYANGNHRIWLIVDDVVEFSDKLFPLDLPEEQTQSPFHWIVTGSAGIGSWVAKRHLDKFIFHLPLFSPDETFDFATKLSSHVDVGLSEGIDGIPHEGLHEWLEERFGGIVGYTTELLFAIADKKPVSDYLMDLNKRVGKIISNTAERTHISNRQLAEDWIHEIKVGSYDMHLWYWRVLTPQVITFDPEGVMGISPT